MYEKDILCGIWKVSIEIVQGGCLSTKICGRTNIWIPIIR